MFLNCGCCFIFLALEYHAAVAPSPEPTIGTVDRATERNDRDLNARGMRSPIVNDSAADTSVRSKGFLGR